MHLFSGFSAFLRGRRIDSVGKNQFQQVETSNIIFPSTRPLMCICGYLSGCHFQTKDNSVAQNLFLRWKDFVPWEKKNLGKLWAFSSAPVLLSLLVQNFFVWHSSPSANIIIFHYLIFPLFNILFPIIRICKLNYICINNFKILAKHFQAYKKFHISYYKGNEAERKNYQ